LPEVESTSSKGDLGFDEGDGDDDEEEKAEAVLNLPTKDEDFQRKGSFYPYRREYSVAGNYEEVEELARK